MNTTKLEEGYANAMEWLRENEGQALGKVYSSGKVAREYKVTQRALINTFELPEGISLQPSIEGSVEGSPFSLFLSIKKSADRVNAYSSMSGDEDIHPLSRAHDHVRYNIAQAELWAMDQFLTIWLQPEGLRLVGSVQNGQWAIVEV